MKISEIKIDEEFKNVLPAITNEEYENLRENIAVHSVKQPLILWNGILIDGHNRYRVCMEGGIDDVPVTEMNFEDRDAVIEWILKNQLGRRNLSIHQRNVIALRYEGIIAERAKKRQAEYHGNRFERVESDPHGSKSKNIEGRTSTQIASIAGTSRTSVIRSKLILTKGTEEQKERALRGGKEYDKDGRLIQDNSLSAIECEIRGWENGHKVREKEIINEQEENNESVNEAKKRICRICGNVLLPGEYNIKRGNICPRCTNIQKNVRYRDAKGNEYKEDPEYASLTESEIIGDLYNEDKVIVHTDSDLKEELEVNTKKFFESLESTLQFYQELLKRPTGKYLVRHHINLLVDQAKSIKEKYTK